jgi:hypothetical protein
MGIFGRFFACRRANVSIIMAISAIPLLLAGGVALDFMRASDARTKLQAAIDAAAVAGGVTMDASDAEVKDVVLKFMAKNGAADMVDLIDKVTITKLDSETFRVRAEGAIDSSLMRLAGIEKLPIGTSAEVKRSYGGLEVALVLDNTASMSGEKIENLKNSAEKLVKTVFDDDKNPNVKVSLVPFSQYVNVGMENRDADWLEVENDRTENQNVCNWIQINKTNCRQETCSYDDDGRTVEYSCEQCDGDWQESCSSQPVSIEWHGCVGSRNYPMNVNDTVPDQANSTTLYPGIMNTWCSAPVEPLTKNENKLIARINNMNASGFTYIPVGLQWGWNMLSSTEPFVSGVPYDQMAVQGTKKVLVLMTDGDNTLSPTYPEHDGSDAGLANALTLELCTNIKNAGISIYTVSYEVESVATENMLQNCASELGNYFDADNAIQLSSAFGSIAKKLASLRIAR